MNEDVAIMTAFRELEVEVSYALGIGAPDTGRTTMESSSLPRMR